MARAPRFVGKVREGKFIPDEAGRFAAWLARLEGRRVLATVQRRTEARSLSQNRYLWGVVYEAIAEWSGHEPEEIHEVMKAMFLPARQILMPTGEILTAPPSSRVLDIEAFSDFVSKVMRWAAENGLYVPSSEEMG